MTTHAEAESVLRDTWKTGVADVYPLSTQYDNAPFAEPPGSMTPWARLTIRFGEGSQTEIGTLPSHRFVGIAIAQVFAPVRAGTKVATDVKALVDSAFRAQTLNGVICRTPALDHHGTGGDWHQSNIRIPFQFDDRG